MQRPVETSRTGTRTLNEKSFLKKFEEMRFISHLEDKEKKVLKGCIVHCNDGWLKMFLVKKEKLENNIL